MKKEMIGIFICIFLVVGVFPVTGNVINNDRPLFLIERGTFNGFVIDPIDGEGSIIGNISGTYIFYPIIKDGYCYTRMDGQLEINKGENAGITGAAVFTGGKHFQFGRITYDTSGVRMYSISQISFFNNRFDGDIKIFFGISLRIFGDYQEDV